MRRVGQQVFLALLSLTLAGRARASGAFPAHHEVFTTSVSGAWGFEGRALDLDGDGRVELVTGLSSDYSDTSFVQIRKFGHSPWDAGTVSVIPVLSSVNEYTPRAVAAADLNGDGLLDLVVPVGDSVVVLPAISPGVFGAPIDVAFVPQVNGVAVADFDGDGTLDLAVSLYTPHRVRILHGLSPYSFVPVAEFPTHGIPQDVFVRDWNGDGKPDLLVGADSASTVLLNNGAGGFQASEVATPYAMPAGDFDGDGHEDLISLAGVFLGRGDGTFRQVLASSGLLSVAAADLDEDGRLDFLGVTSGTSGQLSIQRGRGDGTFEPATYRPYARGNLGVTITADFDGDGHVDVAEAGLRGTDLVTFGLGNGLFPDPLRVPVNSPISYIRKGEFGSHTGRDLLLVSKAANSMALFRATGLATWSQADTVALPGTLGDFAYGPEVADLNGDGLDDVVIGYTDRAFVSFWLTDANGHFGPRTDLETAYPATTDVALGDIDQDGDVDILVQPSFNGGVQYDGLPIQWYRNRGNGQFDDNGTLPFVGIGNLEIRDLNGDGIPDLAMLSRGYGIRVAIATAPGVFGASVELLPQGIPYSAQRFVVGRFDGDSVPDLVLTNLAGAWYFHGVGDGSFAPAVFLPGAAFDVNAFAADLDGDGRDEIVSGTKVVGLKADGSVDGVFGFAVATMGGGGLLTALDADGNGALDLVGPVWNSPTLAVLLNKAGTQTLGVRPPGARPTGLAVRLLANPCGRSVRVRLSGTAGEPAAVELLDVQGRRLRRATGRPDAEGAIAVDLGATAGLPPGVYLVRARQGRSLAVARAVVIH